MSSDYHTPIPTNSPANAAVFNAPMGQLDASIGNTLAGTNPFSKLLFNAASTLTIASGSVTPTAGLHIIAAESGTADNLDTITAVNNSILFIKADSGDTITLTSSGNLNADSIALTGNSIIGLFCQNSQWSIISYPLYEAINNRIGNRLQVSGLEIDTLNATDDITIYPGECSSDNGNTLMEFSATGAIDITGTGINKLDTGVVANDTWYYIWALKGTSGVGFVASTSVTNPTEPSGYTTYKRRIGAFRTDGTASPYSSYMLRGQYGARRVYYREVTNAAPYQILNEANIGTSGAQTTVNCSALVPATCRTVIAQITVNTPTGAGDIFWNDQSSQNTFIMTLPATGHTTNTVMDLQVEWNSGIGRIYASTANDEDLSFHVLGYIDDGLAYLGYTP